MSQDRPGDAQTRKDDQVRELFKWVEEQEDNGVGVATIIDQIGNRARRHALKACIRINAVTRVSEVTFADTEIIIRHDGSKWHLA